MDYNSNIWHGLISSAGIERSIRGQGSKEVMRVDVRSTLHATSKSARSICQNENKFSDHGLVIQLNEMIAEGGA
jgi:hypothetical protein